MKVPRTWSNDRLQRGTSQYHKQGKLLQPLACASGSVVIDYCLERNAVFLATSTRQARLDPQTGWNLRTSTILLDLRRMAVAGFASTVSPSIASPGELGHIAGARILSAE